MGNLKACFIVATVALAACGSDKAATVDAPVVIHDSPVDTKLIDAAPDAAPVGDFTCFGMPNPTTAADPITLAGTTDSLGQGGIQPLPGVKVQVFKSGVVAALDTQTSDAQGAFTSGNIVTAGMPFDGYLEGSLATYRTSYLYPPNPATASIAGLPVPMITDQTFQALSGFAGSTQDDANNGAFLLTVTDCSNTPLNGATISLKQGGQDVTGATQFDLGQLSSQAAGIIAVFNVPDGATDISATYNNMTFPTHTVLAHKKPNGQGAVGTLTLTTVRPGP